MSAHEHDSHPHFRGVVLHAKLRDDAPDEEFIDGACANVASELPVALRRGWEAHALIYTDGCVAVTLYECCYCMWSVSDGVCMGGSLWKDAKHVLTPVSLATLRRHADGVLSVANASAAARAVDALAMLERIPVHKAAEREIARVRVESTARALRDATARLGGCSR